MSQVGESNIDQEMAAKIRELFHNVDGEVFEDGITSNFSTVLHGIISEYGAAAVEQLREITLARDVPIDIAEEALRQIGHIKDAATHDARLSLLERALESPELRIRDGGVMGIDYMEDPRAVPSLERALEREKYEWLGQYIRNVIARLSVHHEVSEDH